MNLVIIAALVAATVADKLDRTYLPPPSAKTAGGSSGSLQTPFASNSLNGGLGSLPKGSYANEFQGVVVDAVAPGIRASSPDDTGLGAPRISYGSTNSKVGDAAFKTNPAAFGQASVAEVSQSAGLIEQGFPNQTPGSATPERPRAALDRAANTIKFNSEVGPESYSYSFETDNGIVAEENGIATNGVQAQGGFSYTGDDGQIYTVTYTADEDGYHPKGDHLPTPPPIPEEILRSIEQNARDEAAGLVDDGSYDAQKYNTGGDYADNGDTNGKYSHQSSKFGGAGETDVTASGSFISQNKQSGRPGQSSPSAEVFGNGNEVEHSQGHNENNQVNTGIHAKFGSSQSGQTFGNGNRYTDNDGHSGHIQGNNGFNGLFGSSSFGNGASSSSSSLLKEGSENSAISGQTGAPLFAETGQSISRPNGNTNFPSQDQTGFNSNRFGQTSKFTSNSNQGSRFGNRNEYLPPVNSFDQNRPQDKRPGLMSASPLDQLNKEQTQTEQFFPTKATGNRPQGTNSAPSSRGKPIPNGSTGQFGIQKINQDINRYQPNNAGPSTSGESFGSSQRFGDRFSSKNEYLPPSNNFGMKNTPAQKQPLSNKQFNQQYNANYQVSANMPSQNPQQEPLSNSPSPSFPMKQPSFGFNSHTTPQNNGRPNYQNNNHFPLSQSSAQSQFTASVPGVQSGSQETQPGQFQNQFNVQKSTSQPEIELTTPLESNGLQNTADVSPTTSFNTRPSQSTFEAGASASTAPFHSFGSHHTSRPQKSDSRPFGTRPAQIAGFPTQPASEQYHQSQTNSQFGATSTLSQDNDVKGAPSTPSPTFAQQSQESDDSYYYKQPSKPFGPTQGSRFSTAQSNQFNRGPQRPQNNQFVAQQQSNYPSQNNEFQGSSMYPMPPSIVPTASSQNHFQSSSLSAQYNGITQASISPFSSQAPTQPTQFTEQGQFGKPNNQPTKPFSRTPSRLSFGQTTMTQALFSQTTATPFIQKPNSRQPTFQPQQSLISQPEPTESGSEETPSQQYNGELYEYNKPPEVLPAPENNKPSGSAMLVQNEHNKFGAPLARPQVGQKNENSETPSTQFGQAQNSRPFGTPSKPQFGQKIHQSGFGSQSIPQTSFQPQFGQAFASGSTQDQSNGQNYPSGSQPSSSEVQKPSSSCCQGSQQSGSLLSSLRPLQGFGSQTQNKFGQSSFPGSQSMRPEASVSSFAGKGEQFGGPRKPPSFDDKTGYYY